MDIKTTGLRELGHAIARLNNRVDKAQQVIAQGPVKQEGPEVVNPPRVAETEDQALIDYAERMFAQGMLEEDIEKNIPEEFDSSKILEQAKKQYIVKKGKNKIYNAFGSN